MKFFLVLIFALLSVFSFVSCDKPAKCLEQNGVAGKCLAYIPSYTYNPASDECTQFIYGGCGGSENRFGTKEDCETTCKNVK